MICQDGLFLILQALLYELYNYTNSAFMSCIQYIHRSEILCAGDDGLLK